jgi:hypothetical protein
MITIEILTQFFGWCAVINMSLLVITTVSIMIFEEPISKIHNKLFAINEEKLQLLYFQFIAYYKLAIIIFNLVPYFALKLIV